jgi:hypothetical protein
LTLRPGYAAAALIVLLVEIIIALFVRDAFVRPYLGDTLAVILVYLALRAVTGLRVLPAALIALVIAFVVEFGQWFGLVDRIGLGGSPVARVALGTGFEPLDFVAYTAGALAILAFEALRANIRRAS